MQNTIQGWKLNSVWNHSFLRYVAKNVGKPWRSEFGDWCRLLRILIFWGELGLRIPRLVGARGFRNFVLFVGPRVRLKTVMFSTRFPDEAV